MHHRLDGRGEPARQLVEIQDAGHRAGQSLQRTYVVLALPEERSIDEALHPASQRLEGQRHTEHEQRREPRRPAHVGVDEDHVRDGDRERIARGDHPRERRVDHRAPDDDRGVEEPVAHGGVRDRQRIQEDERRAHLRIHARLVRLHERQQHQREPESEAQRDPEQQDRRLLVHQRRRGAPARVEQRDHLDRERDERQEHQHAERVRVHGRQAVR